jgi:hypothetical protein
MSLLVLGSGRRVLGLRIHIVARGAGLLGRVPEGHGVGRHVGGLQFERRVRREVERERCFGRGRRRIGIRRRVGRRVRVLRLLVRSQQERRRLRMYLVCRIPPRNPILENRGEKLGGYRVVRQRVS